MEQTVISGLTVTAVCEMGSGGGEGRRGGGGGVGLQVT